MSCIKERIVKILKYDVNDRTLRITGINGTDGIIPQHILLNKMKYFIINNVEFYFDSNDKSEPVLLYFSKKNGLIDREYDKDYNNYICTVNNFPGCLEYEYVEPPTKEPILEFRTFDSLCNYPTVLNKNGRYILDITLIYKE